MEEDGFEPSKLEATDLQSAPFGHSGTLPYSINGAGGRTWTPDLLITNQLLYQLSYTSAATIFIISQDVPFVKHFFEVFDFLSFIAIKFRNISRGACNTSNFDYAVKENECGWNGGIPEARAIRRQTANPAHSAQRNPAAQKRRMISFSNRNHVIFTKKSVAFPLHLCYNL